ncbi:MAG: hypothetical protein Tsb005_18920 [Gammaproteobacteria bacterium]
MRDFLQLKRLRKQLGFSRAQMADALGLSGPLGETTVQKMENGTEPITGPIQKLISYLNQTIAGDEHALPEFISGQSLDSLADGETDHEVIFHTRYPRFLAWVLDNSELEEGMTGIKIDFMESLVIGMWIDDPDIVEQHDVLNKLQKAATLMQKWNENI